MSDTKDQTINSMCLTWRHDFGLDKRHDAFGYSGMTPDERDALRRRMAQLFEHHIAPVIARNEQLREIANEQRHRLECLCEGTDGSTPALTRIGRLEHERDQFRAEAEELRMLLSEAADEIGEWGAYASEYFQEKHDLAGCVARFRAGLRKGGRHDG